MPWETATMMTETADQMKMRQETLTYVLFLFLNVIFANSALMWHHQNPQPQPHTHWHTFFVLLVIPW